MKLALFDPQSDSSPSDLLKQAGVYSTEELCGTTVLKFPLNASSTFSKSQQRAAVPLFIPESLKNDLISLSEQQNSNLFVLLLSIYKVMLYRYSNQNERGIGAMELTPERQLMSPRNMPVVNVYSNLDGEFRFTDVLDQIQSLMSEQNYHSVDSSKKPANGRIKNEGKAKEVFVFDRQLKAGLSAKSVRKSNFKNLSFDLMVSIIDGPEDLHGCIEYSSAAYGTEAIHRMAVHYLQLLQAVVNDPQQKIGCLPMLSGQEEHALLYRFNDTLQPYAKEKTLSGLFEEQVRRTPDNIALILENATMTYRSMRTPRLA